MRELAPCPLRTRAYGESLNTGPAKKAQSFWLYMRRKKDPTHLFSAESHESNDKNVIHVVQIFDNCLAAVTCQQQQDSDEYLGGVAAQQWAIQQFSGCLIQVLAVLGGGSGFRYAYIYIGFIYVSWDDVMSYPQMQQFHRVSADADSAVAAIAAGMRDGRVVAERCFPASLEGGTDGTADAPHLTV